MGKGVIANFTVLMQALRPPVTQKAVRQRMPNKTNPKKQVLTVGKICPPNAITEREEPRDDELEDTSDQQILGDSGVLVDEDSDDEDGFAQTEAETERDRLAAERRALILQGDPLMGPGLPPFSGQDNSAQEEGERVRAALERQRILEQGYAGFRPGAASSGEKRTREESSDEGDSSGKKPRSAAHRP
jgi:hypothetical protein